MRGVFCLALGLFAIVCFGPVLAAENEKAESLYFALVLNGRHTGYMEMTITPGNTAGAPTVTVQEMVQKVKTLGTTTTVTYRSTRETAPGSGKVLSVDSEVTQGSRKTGSTLIFKDGEVFVTPKPEGEVKTLTINSATIVDDGISFPYLLKDFSDQNVKTKIYPVLDTMRNEIIERIYTRGGPAKVKLAGRIFECLVFESADKKIGVRGKVWVDTATGRAVRTENSMGVITYLADKSYKKRFLSGEPIDKVETVKPKAPTAELQPVGEVPWKVGESYQYLYTYGDKKVGTETFTLKSIDETQEGVLFNCASEMEIQKVILAFEWQVDRIGRPIDYSSKTKTKGTRYSVECAFGEKEVAIDAHRLGHPMKKTVPLPETVRLVDDNNVNVFAFLALAAPKEEGAICVFEAFHPTKIEQVTCRLEVKGAETISWNGQDVACRRIDMTVGETGQRSIQMWINSDGLLLRQTEQSGLMVMELAGE